MDGNSTNFGDFLRQLIKNADMSQAYFYTKLGIKKPYFYDILSGRVNPPPPPLQLKMMDILQADENTRNAFFDLAAKERGEMPADITQVVTNNPAKIAAIRNSLKKSESNQSVGGI